jgi:hypothetical protein
LNKICDYYDCQKHKKKNFLYNKESTGRAGGFEGLANPLGIAPIGGFTNQSPFALLDAL